METPVVMQWAFFFKGIDNQHIIIVFFNRSANRSL